MTKGNRGKTNHSPFSLLTIWSGGKVAWQAHTTLGIKTVMYMKRTPGRESWRNWSCVNYPVKMGICPPSRVSHPCQTRKDLFLWMTSARDTLKGNTLHFNNQIFADIDTNHLTCPKHIWIYNDIHCRGNRKLDQRVKSPQRQDNIKGEKKPYPNIGFLF